ncbi:5810_t:CDS:2 [Funneliformis caledonium]|uniref:5810_t:CDS:1 n=1 Tax=Funneliformis caledonium TaxID=1117310 RepID=A0A9N9EWB5_9GLOM|nr:5810_t:CDS:2 [Funneliformis caledonium]
MNQTHKVDNYKWKHPIAGTIQPSMYNSCPSGNLNGKLIITEIQYIARYG